MRQHAGTPTRLLATVVGAALVAPALALLAPQVAAAAGPLTPGNLVVVRVGDGSAALSSGATPVFLDEYTTAGALVGTTPLPTTGSGANQPLTLSGSATSEGALARSADGRYLTLAGYGATIPTSSVGSSSARRVVARVDGTGAVDTSTALTDAYTGNNIRGAVSSDGSGFWTGGTATSNGGTRYAALGASTSTQVAGTPSNARVPAIADGQLYVSSGSSPNTGVNRIGSGLPTSGPQTATVVAASTSPYAYTFLDRSDTVPGVDTLYVADDSVGLAKFSSDGSTWTARGTFKPGGAAVRGVTGTGAAGSAALFATTTTNALVGVTDSAAFNADLAAGSTPLATGGTNTALRGVAFAPAAAASAPTITSQPDDVTVASGGSATLTVTATGTAPLRYQWSDDTGPIPGATSAAYSTGPLTTTTSYSVLVSNDQGNVRSRTATVTVSGAPETPPTITPATLAELALTVDDPTGPPALRTVTIGDNETDAASLTLSVTSSNPGVATGGTTGSGATRTVVATPVGVGRATLTVTVSDGSQSASATLPVAVSGALPAGTLNHYGASDASTAQDLGDDRMVVADDETNVLRTYSRTASRYPSAQLDLRAAGLAVRDSDPTREIDIEASARTGDTIIWLGSHGQNSSNKTRLNRQELFSTTVAGDGTLSLGGSYQKLRDDLLAWDDGNGGALGLRAAAGRAPEGDGTGPTGFNIEGAEFAADGTTLYVGFRGPLVGSSALVVPVTNATSLVTANPSAGPATFGSALLWDLGGRGVREIRRNPAGSYLVIAGPSDGGTGAAGEFRFYSWDGDRAHAPVLRAGSLDAVAAAGKPEAIVSVPSPLTGTSSVQVLTDSGDTVWYGDGAAAKDLPLPERKATSAYVSVGAPPACSTGVTPIGAVQGSAETSPLAGTTVTVRGTVVSDDEGASPALRGFYLQDSGDGDSATSDALFVFDNGLDLVGNGDVVEVTGSVSEFQGQTQLTATASGTSRCGGVATVAPTDVTLPLASASALEPYEGMLVRLPQQLSVTESFQLGRFGEVRLSSGGRLQQPTNVLSASNQAAVQALQAQNDLNQVVLDDSLQSQNPDPIVFARGGAPLSADNTLRIGDTTTGAVGVLTYTWAGNAASGNTYRVRPQKALGGSAVFDPTNPRPSAPPAVGGGLKVASANLLNFFNTFSGCRFGVGGASADCRGAENAAEYDRQLAKEVASIRFLRADVVGYMEMENDGYGSDSAVQALVDALNTADGARTWAFVNPDAALGVVNSAGTDAIKAGQIYRTAAVTPVEGATFTDRAQAGGSDQFERHPVAQTYTAADGGRFTVVANHFKSKGSCPTSGPDTDQGDGQACWNARRTAQANELVRWVRDVVVPGAGDPDVLVLGDLNAYAGEDPIAVLEAAGYVNEIKRFQGRDAYSYVFDGQSGYLDQMLASSSLSAQTTGAGDVHHNADEPSVLDYNTNFKSPGQVASLYAPDRFRTSDHDPVLLGLTLGAAPTISGSPGPATVGQPYSYAFAVSDGATVALTGGSLPPGLALSPDGVLSGTPTDGGSYAFTLRATNAYGAADLAVTLTVGRADSTTALEAAPDPVATGAPLTLTATVPGATGTVTFRADATVLGDAALSGGTATLTVTTLAAGSHDITATYGGSSALRPSTSAAVTVRVVDPVVLTGSLPDGTVATPYRATVPYSGGGSVTFTVVAGTLPAGLSLSTDGVLSGTPTVAEDAAFTVRASNAVSSDQRTYRVVIAAAASRTTVTTPANPSSLGAGLTFTAHVFGSAGTTVGGTVQFSIDGAAFGPPVPVGAGIARSQRATGLSAGRHTVAAAYSGDGALQPSTGTVVQSVRYVVRVLTPASGATVQAGSAVRIAFQLTDVRGRAIPAAEAAALVGPPCRVTVSAAGVQRLARTCASLSASGVFSAVWQTAARPAGKATISIRVTYPGDALAQVVDMPLTLRR